MTRPIRHPWPTWQENFIREKYGLMPTSDIARFLNRTPQAVRLKIHRMMGKCFNERFRKQIDSWFHGKRT